MALTVSDAPVAEVRRSTIEEIQDRVAWGAETGLDRWSTVMEFRILDGETVHVAVSCGRMTLNPGSHPLPTTILECTKEALVDVFRGRRDITHEFAERRMTLRSGDYYDTILLSRALRRVGARGAT
jgi:hypothetical protein